MFNKKIFAINVFIFLILISSAVLVIYTWFFSIPDLNGIYIVPDGVSCLIFTNDLTKLKMKAVGQNSRFESSDDLIIEKGMVYLPVAKEGLPGYFPATYYAVRPSKRVPGDWDLVRPGFRLEPEDGDGDQINFPKKNPDFLKKPIPYLHRLNDEKVLEYFDIIKNEINEPVSENDGKKLLDLAEEIVRDHPADPYAHIFHLDALIRNQDAPGLEKKLAEVKSAWLAAEDKYLGVLYHRSERALEGIQAQSQGRNAFNFINETINPDIDLNSRLKAIHDIDKFDTLYPCTLALTGFVALPGSQAPFNYFGQQLTVKVILMKAYLNIIEGKSAEALDLLVSTYKLGLLIAEETDLVGNYIGRALQGIALKGLEIYFLNDAQNPEKLEEVCSKLEDMNKVDIVGIYQNCMKQSYWTPYKEAGYDYYEGYLDLSITNVLEDIAKFRLLQSAVAARHCLLKNGAFPKDEAGFAPLLSNGLPDDPFGDGPLEFASAPDSITIYSHGPDEDDDHISVEYDPTNGVISNGDIFLKVPRIREFPFPENGLKGTSVADVYRQFPYGLPRDIFADDNDTGLGVSEDDKYIYIYSVGPDVNQQEIMNIPNYIPTIQYDPTNGATSDGDLFIKLPR